MKKTDEEQKPVVPAVQEKPVPVEGYIDKRECARRLGKTVRTVDTLMAKGAIPFYKLAGRTVAFRWSEVDAYIQAHYRVCLRG